MTATQAQLNAIMNLPPLERYKHAIKIFVGKGILWSLYKDGWCLAGDKGENALPLWPEKDYAVACIRDGWADQEAMSISLSEFINEMLSKLVEDNIKLYVFMTPDSPGIIADHSSFISHIETELDKY